MPNPKSKKKKILLQIQCRGEKEDIVTKSGIFQDHCW